MGFQFAYSLDGTSAHPISDMPLDTVANYKTGAGTADAKSGDLVFMNSGLLRRVIAGTGSTNTAGVLEGTEFLGLVAQGQPYAATNSSFTAEAVSTKYPNGVGKVRRDKNAVYKVPVGAGQTATNTHLNQSYTIALDAVGDQTVNLAVQTTPCVKVIDYTKDGKFVFVTLL